MGSIFCRLAKPTVASCSKLGSTLCRPVKRTGSFGGGWTWLWIALCRPDMMTGASGFDLGSILVKPTGASSSELGLILRVPVRLTGSSDAEVSRSCQLALLASS